MNTDIELGGTRATTRRLRESSRIDVMNTLTDEVLKELDEGIEFASDTWREHGECEITITVRQVMKIKPRCDQWCDPQTGVHSHG